MPEFRQDSRQVLTLQLKLHKDVNGTSEGAANASQLDGEMFLPSLGIG